MRMKRITHPFFGEVVNKQYRGSQRRSVYEFNTCIRYDRFLGYKSVPTTFDLDEIWLRPEYTKMLFDSKMKRK